MARFRLNRHIQYSVTLLSPGDIKRLLRLGREGKNVGRHLRQVWRGRPIISERFALFLSDYFPDIDAGIVPIEPSSTRAHRDFIDGVWPIPPTFVPHKQGVRFRQALKRLHAGNVCSAIDAIECIFADCRNSLVLVWVAYHLFEWAQTALLSHEYADAQRIYVALLKLAKSQTGSGWERFEKRLRIGWHLASAFKFLTQELSSQAFRYLAQASKMERAFGASISELYGMRAQPGDAEKHYSRIRTLEMLDLRIKRLASAKSFSSFRYQLSRLKSSHLMRAMPASELSCLNTPFVHAIELHQQFVRIIHRLIFERRSSRASLDLLESIRRAFLKHGLDSRADAVARVAATVPSLDSLYLRYGTFWGRGIPRNRLDSWHARFRDAIRFQTSPRSRPRAVTAISKLSSDVNLIKHRMEQIISLRNSHPIEHIRGEPAKSRAPFIQMWSSIEALVGGKRVRVWTTYLRGDLKPLGNIRSLMPNPALLVSLHRESPQFYFRAKPRRSPTSETVLDVIVHALKNRGVAGDIHELLAAVRHDPSIRNWVAELRTKQIALATTRDATEEEALRAGIADLEAKLEALEGNLKSCVSREVNKYLKPFRVRLSATIRARKGVKARAKYVLVPPISFCLIECG